MRGKITVIHLGAVGDVLLAIPALRRLGSRYPGRALGLIAREEASRLLLACGEVQAIFSLESGALTGLFSGSLRPDLQDWLEQSDLVVCWMTDRDHEIESILCDRGIRRVISGSPLSTVCVAEHQEDRLIELLGCGRAETREFGPLILPAHLLVRGRTLLRSAGMGQDRCVAVLHPGSGSRHKCVPAALFLPVLDWCRAAGIQPVLIEGPADRDAVAELIAYSSPALTVIRHESLLSIAGILGHAHFFVGHDSGLTHLAARLNVLTVALFGPTDPRRWAPRGEHVTVLTGAACRCEGWQAVTACSRKACLDIPVEKILAACVQALQRRHQPASPASRYLVMPGHLC